MFAKELAEARERCDALQRRLVSPSPIVAFVLCVCAFMSFVLFCLLDGQFAIERRSATSTIGTFD